ncbi:MAG TPA: glycosyltransferase family 4 protein [Planctomycetota bacterium]
MGAPPILFASHVVEWGGAESVLVDLLTELDRSRITPHFVCPGPGPLAARVAQLGIAVHNVPMGGSSPWRKAIGLPRAARGLRGLAAELACRVVVANSMIAGYAAVLAQHRQLRCLWHLHVVTRSRIARFALRRAAAVMTPSRAGAVAVEPGIGDSRRLRVVPNGVPDRFFAAAGTGLRERLGVPAGMPLVGIVGRLDPHKGHDVLLQAVARLDGVPPVHVVVAGSEAFASLQSRVRGFTDELRERIGALGLGPRVHLIGHVDDTAPLLAQLDVVVVPSIALESAPRSIAEAQAAGCAVVASAIGGVPELVASEQSGLLVPPGDVDSLQRSLARVLGDPALRSRLVAGGRAKADADYRMNVFAARCVDACLAVQDLAS